MASKPITNSGLNTTLTRRRILEVSPWFNLHRRNSPQELRAFWNKYPENNEGLFRDAWQSLVDWYLGEAKEVGERRAFWKLVYKLLDQPTNDDLAWIQIWLYSYLSAIDDVPFPCWMEDLWD